MMTSIINTAADAGSSTAGGMEGGLGLEELGREIEDLIRTPSSDAFKFTEMERKVLELWDKEEEMRLEMHLLQAQHEAQDSDISTLTDQQVESQLNLLEKDLLTARTTHKIRQSIIQHALILDPILKSLHSPHNPNTTALERRLPPLLHERDTLSMVSSLLSTRLQNLRREIARLEVQNMEVVRDNRGVADRVRELAGEVKGDGEGVVKRDEEVDRRRKEWRVWKSLVAGVVVGSGVDWGRDAKLLEVVMDDEDEME